MRCLVLLFSAFIFGCSDIPEVSSTGVLKIVEYHETDKCHRFSMAEYPELKKKVEDTIKSNQSGWRYYLAFAEPVPDVVARGYSGTNQVYALSVRRSGHLIIRDFQNPHVWRKKDPERCDDIFELLDTLIERDGLDKTQFSEKDRGAEQRL